jgi:hypothetical protein
MKTTSHAWSTKSDVNWLTWAGKWWGRCPSGSGCGLRE